MSGVIKAVFLFPLYLRGPWRDLKYTPPSCTLNRCNFAFIYTSKTYIDQVTTGHHVEELHPVMFYNHILEMNYVLDMTIPNYQS